MWRLCDLIHHFRSARKGANHEVFRAKPSFSGVRSYTSPYIVNTEQILRVELFGKETYQVRLKDGTYLRASSAGYKLLKERLSL